MPIQILPSIDVGGRIGRALGEGLGTAAEREFSRGRLSKALESTKAGMIDPSSGQLRKGLSGIDVFSGLTSALYGIPGGPEYLQAAFPLIMQSIQRQPGTEGVEFGGEKTVPSVTPTVGATEGLPEEALAEATTPRQANVAYARHQLGISPESLQTAEGVQSALRKEWVPTRQERQEGIRRIANTRQIPLEQAAAQYDRDVEQTNADLRAEIERTGRSEALESKSIAQLDDILRRRLTPDEMQSIGGLQTRLEASQLQRVRSGTPPRKAAQEVGEIAKNLVRASNEISGLTAINKLSSPPEDWRKSIQELRKPYEEIAALPELAAKIQSDLKVAPYGAHALAMPLAAPIQKSIEGLPINMGFGRISPKQAGEAALQSTKIRNLVKKNWDPNQSLMSLKFSLMSQFNDDQWVNGFIEDMINDGTIELSDYQKIERSKIREPMGVPSIKDFALYYTAQNAYKKDPWRRLVENMIASRYKR